MLLKNYILMFSLVFLTFGIAQESKALTRSKYTRRGGSTVTPSGIYYRRGVLFDAAYFFGSNNLSSSSSQTTITQTSFFDIKLGYINQAAFYYGAQYTFRSDVNQTTKSQGRGSGFGIGYFWQLGFDLRAYYRFHESYADYSKGSGFQVDLGYSARIVSHMYLGFLVDYREIKYQVYSLNATQTSTVIRTLQPSVTIGWLFD